MSLIMKKTSELGNNSEDGTGFYFTHLELQKILSAVNILVATIDVDVDADIDGKKIRRETRGVGPEQMDTIKTAVALLSTRRPSSSIAHHYHQHQHHHQPGEKLACLQVAELKCLRDAIDIMVRDLHIEERMKKGVIKITQDTFHQMVKNHLQSLSSIYKLSTSVKARKEIAEKEICRFKEQMRRMDISLLNQNYYTTVMQFISDFCVDNNRKLDAQKASASVSPSVPPTTSSSDVVCLQMNAGTERKIPDIGRDEGDENVDYIDYAFNTSFETFIQDWIFGCQLFDGVSLLNIQLRPVGNSNVRQKTLRKSKWCNYRKYKWAAVVISTAFRKELQKSGAECIQYILNILNHCSGPIFKSPYSMSTYLHDGKIGNVKHYYSSRERRHYVITLILKAKESFNLE